MTSGIFAVRVSFNGQGIRDRYSTTERVDLQVSLLKNKDYLQLDVNLIMLLSPTASEYLG
jgi:hypothetical protein